MLFLGQRYADLAPTSGKGALSPERIVILDGPAQGRMLSYEQLTYGSTEDELHFPEAEDNDTTVIMFTAGTTGVPKGVMLTHESFSSFLLATVNPADPDDEESNLLTVPLYHIAGLQAALAAVYGGRTLVVMRQFDPLEWLTLAQTHQVTRDMQEPTMLKREMDQPQIQEFDL